MLLESLTPTNTGGRMFLYQICWLVLPLSRIPPAMILKQDANRSLLHSLTCVWLPRTSWPPIIISTSGGLQYGDICYSLLVHNWYYEPKGKKSTSFIDIDMTVWWWWKAVRLIPTHLRLSEQLYPRASSQYSAIEYATVLGNKVGVSTPPSLQIGFSAEVKFGVIYSK